MANHTHVQNPKVDVQYRRKKCGRNETSNHFIYVDDFLNAHRLFAVGYEGFSAWFSVPFILLLAVVQVIFQLYYFMHMSHKGHELPALFLYGGVVVAFVTIWAFLTIVWI